MREITDIQKPISPYPGTVETDAFNIGRRCNICLENIGTSEESGPDERTCAEH
jgi:hypothetical protein